MDLSETIADLAAKLALTQPNLGILRDEYEGQYSSLILALHDHLCRSDDRGRLLLPDLSAFGNKSVAVFSDYAGEGSGDYDTYAFLVCALDFREGLGKRQREVRDRFRLGDKEIAFKDFRMGAMQDALPDFLRNADTFMPGFLLTVAIHKTIGSMFHAEGRQGRRALAEQLEAYGFGDWKRDVAEKLLRIVDIAAFLTGLLAHPGQKVFWMTDHDAICANKPKHRNLLQLFQNAVQIYAPHALGTIGGATPFPERTLDLEDLLSIADVTASSIEHYLSRRDAAKGGAFEVKGGAQHVLQWLANDGIALKKSILKISPGEAGTLKVSTLELSLETTPENAQIVPISVRRARRKPG